MDPSYSSASNLALRAAAPNLFEFRDGECWVRGPVMQLFVIERFHRLSAEASLMQIARESHFEDRQLLQTWVNYPEMRPVTLYNMGLAEAMGFLMQHTGEENTQSCIHCAANKGPYVRCIGREIVKAECGNCLVRWVTVESGCTLHNIPTSEA